MISPKTVFQNILITGQEDGIVNIWDLDKNQLLKEFQCDLQLKPIIELLLIEDEVQKTFKIYATIIGEINKLYAIDVINNNIS